MFTVISYDISNDKRRKKVRDLLEGYGDRVQYSVFECNLTKSQIKLLGSKLKSLINAGEDNLRLYQICEGCFTKIKVIGDVPLSDEPAYYLL